MHVSQPSVLCRRLHDEETKQIEQKPKFSAWNWLHQEDSVVSSQQQQSDALYVLGVAGLASEKLLQKHHLQMRNSAFKSNGRTISSSTASENHVIDIATEQSSLDDGKPQKSKDLVLEMIRKSFIQVALKRQKLLQFQKKRLPGLVRGAVVGVSRTPLQLCRRAWYMGGGKRNVVFAASLLVAFTFLILQPLAKTAIRESLNMTVG